MSTNTKAWAAVYAISITLPEQNTSRFDKCKTFREFSLKYTLNIFNILPSNSDNLLKF